MPLQPDMAPMELLCEPLNLMFRWSGGSQIEVGRSEEGSQHLIWDLSIGVYDHATGKIVISNYEEFRSKIKGWILDQLPDITAEHVRDLVDGFGSSNLVLYPSRSELFIRDKRDPEGVVLVDADDVRDLLNESDYDEDGDITEAAADRIAVELNENETTFRNIVS